MDRRDLSPLRSLPRIFLPGLEPDVTSFELPSEELQKLRKVLRLSTGDPIAILPGDGRILRCKLDGRSAVVILEERIETEPSIRVTLAQALPKGDKLDEIVKMTTEIGVGRIVLFPSDRTVVKWDSAKLNDRLRRLSTIAREAAEVAFRSQIPLIEHMPSLQNVLQIDGTLLVLSEAEGVQRYLSDVLTGHQDLTLVVGPEGGWASRELDLIGDRAVTLGPRVLRVTTAAVAACALALLSSG